MTKDFVRALSTESLAWVHAMDADPFLGNLIRGDLTRQEYVLFLARTYHYVRWSGPILAETAEGLRRAGRYPWLVRLFEEKTEEEAPHDQWALGDLRALGVNVEIVKARSPGAAVMAYVAWSRAMAEQGSPAFLGAAYALELISMHRAGAAAMNLCARSGIPDIDGAVSFLAGHGDADVAHIEVLHDVLRNIDDPRDQEAILLSASVLRALFPLFFGAPESAALHRAPPTTYFVSAPAAAE
ncbi:MAG: iron-containing redox enzyme family protein [Polyangiaceae bacterium]